VVVAGGISMAASGFGWLAGGILAVAGGSSFAASDRNRPKITENQQVTSARKYTSIDVI
jgi:hypothetical protein